jgi:hypothetical protein
MIYKCGRVYWFEFWHAARRVRESIGLADKAAQAEAIRRSGPLLKMATWPS